MNTLSWATPLAWSLSILLACLYFHFPINGSERLSQENSQNWTKLVVFSLQINPLSPKSDQPQISHCNINAL